PYLDGLRPHLARAAMLTSPVQLERLKAATTAMQMIGAPAAFVSAQGHIRCANALFGSLVGPQIWDSPSGIRYADPKSGEPFRTLLEDDRRHAATGFSIPLRA